MVDCMFYLQQSRSFKFNEHCSILHFLIPNFENAFFFIAHSHSSSI